MNAQTVADMEIAGKRVLIRADLNVPLEKTEDTTIADLAVAVSAGQLKRGSVIAVSEWRSSTGS